MKKITIIMDGHEETWNFIENLEDLENAHKRFPHLSFAKPYQKKLIEEGEKILMNDAGGYNFLLPTDKIIKIK